MASNATRMYYEFPEVHYSEVIWIYVPPIILCVGTFGNMLSFIVLTRRRLREKSTYLYLAVLAVVDLLVIYVGLFQRWLNKVAGVNFKDTSEFSCRFLVVFGYTITDFSVWLIIAVTVERFIVARFPLHAASMCTKSRASKVIIAVFCILLAINSQFFFTFGLITTAHNRTINGAASGSGNDVTNATAMMTSLSPASADAAALANYTTVISRQCKSQPGFEGLFKIWQFVDACLYSFLPFLVLTVLNVLIIHSVIVSQKEINRRTVEGAPSAAGKHSLHHGSNRRITIMLLTISFTFLFTTTPMNITLIINTYVNSRLDSDPATYTQDQHHLIARLMLLFTVTQMLMFANHSMNFFLYCATGQAFRNQLIALFLCKSDSHHSDSVIMSVVANNRVQGGGVKQNGKQAAGASVNTRANHGAIYNHYSQRPKGHAARDEIDETAPLKP